MIGFVQGDILWVDGQEVCIFIGSEPQSGVGYVLKVTARTAESCERIIEEHDKSASLYVVPVVRDDSEVLYGFGTLVERKMFSNLLKTPGVGPAMALALLGAYPVGQLVRHLREGDVAALCAIPGVGKKTAERLIVDLRGTVESFMEKESVLNERLAGCVGNVSGSEVENEASSSEGEQENPSQLLGGNWGDRENDARIRSEAVEGLLALGYSRIEAFRFLEGAPPCESSDEMLRWALQHAK